MLLIGLLGLLWQAGFGLQVLGVGLPGASCPEDANGASATVSHAMVQRLWLLIVSTMGAKRTYPRLPPRVRAGGDHATQGRSLSQRLLPVLTGITALTICPIIVVASPPSRQSRVPAALTTLIEDYRHGDAAVALAEFMRWDAKRMAVEYEAWDSRRIAAKRFLPADADTAEIAALVMLNTEAAVGLDEFGVTHPPASGTPSHYQAALRLMKLLAARSTDAEVRAFCRDWFVLATSLWLSARQCFQAASTADDALQTLGPDAQLFLAAGSVAEAQMGPFESRTEVEPACGEPWGSSLFTWHGLFMIHNRYREKALTWLQRAVALDPALAEAHLRLGRVFYWADRSSQAQRELERSIAVMSSVERPFVGYLAAIFLGQLHEEARRGEEAKRAYEQAIQFNARGHIAHLALGHLLLMSGATEEGWTRVRAAFGDRADATSPEADPWLNYRSAQLWQAPQRAHALEAWVRR